MASLLAKISWERPRKIERKKKIVLTSSYTNVIENSKKKVKIFKKSENTIMASFRAKICWGRPRKRKTKNRSDQFLPDM